MAKKPKSLPAKQGFGAKNLSAELQKVYALAARQQWGEARAVLETLSQSHPKNLEVLRLLIDTCYELHDMVGYESACERLHELQPNSADIAYLMGGAYLINQHPLLALQAFRQALAKFPNHAQADTAQTYITECEANLDDLLSTTGLSGDAAMELSLLHERGQVALEQGDGSKARHYEQQVLQLKPDFVSASNNLSLIDFLEGNLEHAIVTAKQILETQPDNIHALSNLTRFYCLTGRLEQAQQTAERLKISHAPAWDAWTKKVEGLSYLGDDASILEVFEQAKDAEDIDLSPALFHHLVAVAMARSGQLKSAREQWNQALKKSPGFELAVANLADLKHFEGERHAPWAFPLTSWLTPPALKDLMAAIELWIKAAPEKQLKNSLQTFLNKHPDVNAVIPILLDRGDPQGRELAFQLAKLLAAPDLLNALKDFALSQSGPDSMRHEAALKASEAGLLSSEHIRFWMRGKWQEIALIAYEFHDDPPFERSKQLTDLLSQALMKLRSHTKPAAQEAEQLLKQALELEPDAPDLLNNLALSYEIQGRTDESRPLLYEIAERFPEYIFARASVARLHLEEHNLEAAEALLKPLVFRKRWHFNEFEAFSNAYLELLLAQKQLDSAKVWLKMWEGVDPNHPDIAFWKEQLAPGLLHKMSKWF